MKRGFTLVELIVVVIVLAILAAVGIPQYRKALERSRGAEGSAGLASIQEGEKIYFASNEAYLATTTPMGAEQKALDISLPQTGWEFGVGLIAGPPPGFLATGTRKGSGPCAGKTMTVDQTGTIGPATGSWSSCVDAL